ncbi:MAG: hypothetical protein IIV48_05135 [Clostridium sp.]|nr:hypothetical protein [Clostridium sp.]
MKNYLKYKNFIPKEFIDRKENKEKEKNKRGYKILIVINIVLFYFNIGKLGVKEENNTKAIEPVKNYIEKEEIIKWLNLYDENSIEFKVINNYAEITYENSQRIKELDNLGARIKKVTKYDDRKVVKVTYE